MHRFKVTADGEDVEILAEHILVTATGDLLLVSEGRITNAFAAGAWEKALNAQKHDA